LIRVTISQLSPVAIMQALPPGMVSNIAQEPREEAKISVTCKGWARPMPTGLLVLIGNRLPKCSIGAVWKYRYPSDFR
jgi:hypothetical protein